MDGLYSGAVPMIVTGHRIARVLLAFARDAQDFLQSNPLLLIGLVTLAIVWFGVTRPRVG